MPCIHVGMGRDRMIVTLGGPTYILDGVRFEWSEMFGPFGVNARGGEKKLPGVRHRWWKALQWWIEQGKHVADGVCIYEPPKPERLIHIVGKHYFSVPDSWSEERAQAKVTALLTAAHKRIEARRARRRK